MTNEVKGKIDKLQTTVRWDEEESELVTILKFWAKGITPADLRQLFDFQRQFQRSGNLSFSISSAQPRMFPLEEAALVSTPNLPSVGGADKPPDYPTTEE